MKMPMLLCGAAGAILIAAPAAAQTDPSTFGTAMVQTGQAVTMAHANGQGIRGKSRGYSTTSRSSRAAQTCANLPKVRARLGANNPSVRGLARACREGGYM